MVVKYLGSRTIRNQMVAPKNNHILDKDPNLQEVVAAEQLFCFWSVGLPLYMGVPRNEDWLN